EDIETILSDFSNTTGVNTIVVASRSGIPIQTFSPDDSEDIKEALSAAASGIVHISEYVSDLLKLEGIRDIQINVPGDKHIVAVSAGQNALVMAVLEGEAYVSQAITLVFIAQKIERILAKHPELLPPGDKYIPDYDEDFDENLMIPDLPEED
ncbi:MAG: roadblock/LC7 domain-containing protein, partial [Asgard group archaeon]|nr:roadblock/LC7 domain-containing protein [Asgard group archaeon]